MPNESGRSWFRRGLSEVIDRAFLGNRAHDFSSGLWNKQGAIQGGITGVLGTLNPVLGMAADKGFDMFNRGQPGTGIQGTFLDQGFPSGASGQDMGYATLPNYGGYNPQVNVGAPQTVTTGGYAPTMPTVEAQAPWQGLGTSTGNTFSGGMLGSWAGPQQRQYGQAAGSFTPYGAGVIQNDSWGEAARGFGVGAGAGGSAGGYALADARRAAALNRV